ncbi:hypothetical protein DTL21_17885 [Bremerella cremea]|uniref:Uncharacterized protein n=1 Tax=Blastopirellula marina TaxID=124 RepID=A0A2S8FIW6_9BACT|nr:MULTISPECIES: hypothetical protein [Pirellulaceae]PQO32106.1 hypothetical protein C5Y83_17870 [Blastopirellula marina]RCS45172.1 hypothetical protein DTL21_17885 [Bremerella cremea]
MSSSDDATPIRHSEAFPVRPPVSWVIFPHWPEDGDHWIHPDDRSKAEGLIPSDFIFRRELTDDDWYMLSYGDVHMKTRPVMVDEVPEPKFKMGEIVELAHQFEVDKIAIGTIYAIRYSEYHREPQYYLIRGELKSQNAYLAKDLRPYEPPKEFHAMHEFEP